MFKKKPKYQIAQIYLKKVTDPWNGVINASPKH